VLEKEESVKKLRAAKKEADELMAKVKKREQLAEARCEELVSNDSTSAVQTVS
jgi:hypothetical protein